MLKYNQTSVRRILAMLLMTLSACGTANAPTQPSKPRVDLLPLNDAPALRSIEAGDPTLTIATWNIEHLRAGNNMGAVKRDDDDFARLARYAKRLDADVVAVQEVDSAAALARVFDPGKYDFHVSGRNNVQLTGFAFRRALRVERNPDYVDLDVGQVRHGTDLTVYLGDTPLRLLSVHLKSGCFDKPLTDRDRACQKLRTQVPVLEHWIDDRAREGVAFAVLGDFNRRFFVSHPDGDDFWQEIDDADPPDADLISPTMGQRSACWGGKYPDYIDHIALSKSAASIMDATSFRQLVYDVGEDEDGLSDHCPIAVTIGGPNAGRAPNPSPQPVPPDPDASVGPVKGNVSGSGAKLYHVPGCPSYDQVVIDPDKGEAFFVTEDAAIAAGFVKASNCP